MNRQAKNISFMLKQCLVETFFVEFKDMYHFHSLPEGETVI